MNFFPLNISNFKIEQCRVLDHFESQRIDISPFLNKKKLMICSLLKTSYFVRMNVNNFDRSKSIYTFFQIHLHRVLRVSVKKYWLLLNIFVCHIHIFNKVPFSKFNLKVKGGSEQNNLCSLFILSFFKLLPATFETLKLINGSMSDYFDLQ